MRELVYYVAATLDGFIARTDGSIDDFPWDEGFLSELMELYPETFPAPMRRPNVSSAENRRFGAVLMGRHTYELGVRNGVTNPYPTLDQYVFSRTMDRSLDSAVTLVSEGTRSFVEELKATDGRDIWLCGGSLLAGDLLEASLIDRVVVKLNPVLFGSGLSLFARALPSTPLQLVSEHRFDSGHLLLEYVCSDD